MRYYSPYPTMTDLEGRRRFGQVPLLPDPVVPWKTRDEIAALTNQVNAEIEAFLEDVLRNVERRCKKIGLRIDPGCALYQFQQSFMEYVLAWDRYFSPGVWGWDATLQFRDQLRDWRARFQAIGGQAISPEPARLPASLWSRIAFTAATIFVVGAVSYGVYRLARSLPEGSEERA